MVLEEGAQGFAPRRVVRKALCFAERQVVKIEGVFGHVQPCGGSMSHGFTLPYANRPFSGRGRYKGDYVSYVEALQTKSCRVEVVGIKETVSGDLCSWRRISLRRSVLQCSLKAQKVTAPTAYKGLPLVDEFTDEELEFGDEPGPSDAASEDPQHALGDE